MHLVVSWSLVVGRTTPKSRARQSIHLLCGGRTGAGVWWAGVWGPADVARRVLEARAVAVAAVHLRSRTMHSLSGAVAAFGDAAQSALAADFGGIASPAALDALVRCRGACLVR